MDKLVQYAMSFIGTPYLYGGTSPIKGWDCSEYALELMRSVGVGPKSDANAKAIYSYLFIHGSPGWGAGAFVFYGKNLDEINHIDFMIDDNRVIGMRGGDSTTTNPDRADLQRAYCKVRPYGDRQDALCVLIPKYPDWLK
jgi:hypothetical protein